MIDEWFDRSYQAGRLELHASMDRLIARICRAAVPPRRENSTSIDPEGECVCDGNSSRWSFRRQS